MRNRSTQVSRSWCRAIQALHLRPRSKPTLLPSAKPSSLETPPRRRAHFRSCRATSRAPRLQPAPTVQTPVQNPVQEVRQDYAELAKALQSGDLTTAQSAFTALQQELQTQTGSSTSSTASSTTASATSSDPISNDLSALGQALSSGNLTQAQSAFAQLQTDIRTAQQSATSQSQNSTAWRGAEGHGHHHHHGGGGYSTSNTNSSINVYA